MGGQDRKDLLNINCGIAKNVVEACAKYCPNAIVALIVNPVNSVVPAMAELWAKKGLDPMRIVGVTSLDCVRAEKFVHEITGKPLEEICIPVIGGHAGTTILPLFSQNATQRQSQQTRSQISTKRHKMQVPWSLLQRMARGAQLCQWVTQVLALAGPFLQVLQVPQQLHAHM